MKVWLAYRPHNIHHIQQPKIKTCGVDNHIVDKWKNLDKHQLEDDSCWPIALRKGVWSCQNQVKFSLGQ